VNESDSIGSRADRQFSTAPPIRVVYADPEPNGLAVLLGGLIDGNLVREASRAALLRPSLIGLTSTDAGVSAWVRLARSRVEIGNGHRSGLDVRVSASSADLVDLTSAPLRLGLPDPATKHGRTVIAAVASGRIRISPMLTRAGTLARFNRLVSVR
jgi:hypothetical protein